MENNIQGMLNEIKAVVKNHLQGKNKKMKQTLDVLNNLPIVIELRKKIDELQKENKILKDFYTKYKTKANIELEIIEVEKKKNLETLEKNTINKFFNVSVFSNNDEDEDVITDSEDNPIKDIEPITESSNTGDPAEDESDESDEEGEVDLQNINTHGLLI